MIKPELEEAIAFARKHGITVQVVEATRSILAIYPSGEDKVISIDDERAAWKLNDMAMNLL